MDDAQKIAIVADLADHAPVTRAVCLASHKELSERINRDIGEISRWAWLRFGAGLTFAGFVGAWCLSVNTTSSTTAANLAAYKTSQTEAQSSKEQQRAEDKRDIMARFDRLEAAVDRLRTPK